MSTLSQKQAQQLADYYPRHGLTINSVLTHCTQQITNSSSNQTYKINKPSYKLNNQLTDYNTYKNVF